MRTSTDLLGVDRAVDERELLFAARLVAEDLRLPLGAAARLEGRACDLLDEMVLLEPVGDEIADRADLEAVRPREIHQIVEAGHGPVLAHDLADDAAGVETGETRDVDRGFGVAGADEDPAGFCDEREDVAGGDELRRAR